MRWRTMIDLEPRRIHPSIPRIRGRTPALLTTLVVGSVALVSSFLALGAVSGAQALRSSGSDFQPVIEATHLQPLLSTHDDHLRTLRYDIDCAASTDDVPSGCDIEGTVYVRSGQSGSFRPLALRLDPNAAEGRYAATLPADVTVSASGFSYYAVIRDKLSGATVTLPAAGELAPQRSLRLSSPVVVNLGTHRFGTAGPASTRVASAAWGDGPTDAGLEEGPQLEPIGASSFDVDAAGTVTVLDEAHKRLLRFGKGSSANPASLAVDVRGTIADVAVRPDGGTYVLESVAEPGEAPVLRSFDAAGHTAGAWQTAQPSVAALRLAPGGPQVLEYPAAQWMPIATATKGGETVLTQLAGGRAGRTISGGREIVAQREGDEARIAEINSSGVMRSWRIRSATSLAEVQLAEPLGSKIVAVIRTYTDTKANFIVLVLGDHGVEQHFSVDAGDWAETDPLSRFRLVGSSLFHLGSTRTGMFVDRFDLGVHQ